jgi:hypothetical protein
MRVLRNGVGLAVCALLVMPAAQARELTIANVTDKVACIFTPSCGVVVTDSTGFVQLFGDSGYGRLLTRTYPGMPGTQAAGLTGYSFQLNMAGSMALGMPNCAAKLTLDTGPVVPLRYADGKTADLFVVGGPGIGISSAVQNGGKLTVSFARPICPGSKTAGDSLYFGFAARNAPVPGKGTVTGSLQGTAEVAVRVPKH